MIEIRTSDRLQAAADTLLEGDDDGAVADELFEAADASCTTGYDNDGSTGYEIFKNGFRLAAGGRGREVWEVPSEGSPPSVFFFIGTEDEVLQRILSCGPDAGDRDG